MTGGWREVRAGDTPAAVLAEARAGTLTPFDPQQMQAFPRDRLGAWVVLQPRPPWTGHARVLSIHSPMFGQVTLYDASGPLATTAIDDPGGGLASHGSLAFQLPEGWPASQPVLLKFEPSTSLPATITFRLQTLDDFQRSDALWLSMASASFGVMVAMALMALCFALLLRDITFGWYAGYVISYVVVQGVQTGFLSHPIGLAALAGGGAAFVFAVAASVGFAILFMLRFCQVAQYAPKLQILLSWMVVAIVLVCVADIPDVAWLHRASQAVLNPLLVVCSALVLVAASISALHGVRTAWYFLAGWTPLLVLTAMTSAQVGGAFPRLGWLNEACIGAGAVEAVILSLGLADRALTMRRDRDRARQLADHDALTGLSNRRAWSEAAEARMANGRKAKRVLLFLDLDNFKTLNDQFGHAAGDQALLAVVHALRGELRPGDLLGRFGGEEFVALLERSEPDDAMQVAARLCRRVEALRIVVDDQGRRLTVSIGAAMQRAGDTVASLVHRADQAMYAAKAGGRNQVARELVA
ncbi:MAG TPA: diguanylate cyclase [Rhodanobacteraceae bacterium]|nr:diguanylate cyclase [Rhodanobacteraceae bacterium]